MKLGNKIVKILILYFIFFNFAKAEQKITTTPLLNIEDIKPSFEDLDEKNENISNYKKLKEKKSKKTETFSSYFTGIGQNYCKIIRISY